MKRQIGVERLLRPIRRMQAAIRDRVIAACEKMAADELAAVARNDSGDTIIALDAIIGPFALEIAERELAKHGPLILIAEGMPEREILLPRNADPADAIWRVMLDPIDGTRCLTFQKRPAWVLTGVAPNLGVITNLSHISLAVQTEIPLLKQHLCDSMWAIDGQGAKAERLNRFTGEATLTVLRPSRAASIANGFAMLNRVVAGGREILAQIDEEIVRNALGSPSAESTVSVFEDQYISVGGQLYDMMTGHDRFVGDLRPLLVPDLIARGERPPECAHAYDLCTELIARQAGVIVVDPFGEPLRTPLAADAPVSWVAYANQKIRGQIEPALQSALRSRGWRQVV